MKINNLIDNTIRSSLTGEDEKDGVKLHAIRTFGGGIFAFPDTICISEMGEYYTTEN